MPFLSFNFVPRIEIKSNSLKFSTILHVKIALKNTLTHSNERMSEV